MVIIGIILFLLGVISFLIHQVINMIDFTLINLTLATIILFGLIFGTYLMVKFEEND